MVDIRLDHVSLRVQNTNPLTKQVVGETVLLREMNVHVRRGQLMALMGGSGSGKTTLLNVIAARVRGAGARVGGRVLFAGRERDPDDIAAMSAYVKQGDFLQGHLTVRETLEFSAALNFPPSMGPQERALRVENVILELGLKDVADSRIGNEMVRGISGGEKRRVSIASQLLTDPAVLFLDEPTTGLDSFNAQNIVQTLSNIARHGTVRQGQRSKGGRTVICAIHQPRSDVFALFDNITLLTKGRLVYSGPRAELIPYFTQLGFPFPDDANPADVMVDITSVDVRTPDAERESKAQVARLVQHFREIQKQRAAQKKGNHKQLEHDQDAAAVGGHASQGVQEKGNQEEEEEGAEGDKHIDAAAAAGEFDLSPSDSDESIPALDLSARALATKRPGFFAEVRALTIRQTRVLWRDKLTLTGAFVEMMLMAILFGGMFYQLGEDRTSIRARTSMLYLIASLQPYITLMFQCFHLSTQLKIYDHEREEGTYGTMAWVLGFNLAMAPSNLLFPALHAIIVYAMVGLRDFWSWHLLANIGITIGCHYVVLSMGFFCAAIHRSFAVSSLIANTMYTFCTMTCGFFVQESTMPIWLGWIKHGSFCWYAFRLTAWNEYSDRQFPCPLPDPDDPQCALYDGNKILADLSFSSTDWQTPAIGMFGVWLAFGAVGCFLLKFTSWRFQEQLRTSVTDSKAQRQRRNERQRQRKERQQKPGYQPLLGGGDSDLDDDKYFDAGDGDSMDDKAEREQSLVLLVKGADDKYDEEAPERTPVTVSMEQVSLTVDIEADGLRKPLPILTNVNATVSPGELWVAMGASGSGKSSLLNVIARRIGAECSIGGQVLFNGVSSSDDIVRATVGYVMQADHLLPSLTVAETLTYAAQLRLPEHMPLGRKLGRVKQVIMELGLKDCANTRVGAPGARGISGGEKRRVSIAVQMLTDPSVLLLDEPTSGLDAFTARFITQTLRTLASKGRTVLCSIHQPRSDVYSMFDKLFVLSKGQVVYTGPAKDMQAYFSQFDYVPKCPKLTNPADWLLDISSVDLRSPMLELESRERTARLVAACVEHRLRARYIDRHGGGGGNSGGINRINSEGHKGSIGSGSPRLSPDQALLEKGRMLAHNASSPELRGRKLSKKLSDKELLQLAEEHPNKPGVSGNDGYKRGLWSSNTVSFRVAFPVLFKRAWVNLFRQPNLAGARVGQVLAFGVVLTMFYAPLDTDYYSVQNRVGVLQQYIALLFVGMLNNVSVFPQERNVFYRERADGAYGTLAFFCSYMLAEVVFEVVTAMLYTLVASFALGLQSSLQQLFVNGSMVFALVFAGESVGITFCALVYHTGFAVSLVSTLLSLFNVMAGFLAVDMPAVLEYINYLSVCKWAASAIAVSELEGMTFTCTPEQLLPPFVGICPTTTGEQVLEEYNFLRSDSLWLDVGLVFFLATMYRVCAFIVLHYNKSRYTS